MKTKIKEYFIPALVLLVIITLMYLALSPISLFGSRIITNDSSNSLNIAKAILNGQALYTDIWNHKGPVLYYLNILGILLGFNSLIGVMFLEIIIMFFTCLYLFKISKLFSENKLVGYAYVMIFLLAVSLVLDGGNYTEEYGLLPTMIGIYYVIKFYQEERLVKLDWIIVGFTFALHVFLRVNNAFLYISFGLVLLVKLIKQKRMKEIRDIIIYAVLGFFVTSFVISLPFIINGTFNDLLFGTFGFNFIYSTGTDVNPLGNGLLLILNLDLLIVFSLIGILGFYKAGKKYLMIANSLSLLIGIYFIGMSSLSFTHYAISYIPAIIFSMLGVTYLVNNKSMTTRSLVYISLTFLVLLLFSCYFGFQNRKDYGLDRKYLTDYMWNNEFDSEKDEVAVFGNYTGYYLMLDQIPQYKYFFQIPIVDYDEDIFFDHINQVVDQKPEYIIYINHSYSNYYYEYIETVLKKYEVVYENETNILYRKIEDKK